MESGGAGNGNRTRVFSLEGCCTTIVLYPQTRRKAYFSQGGAGMSCNPVSQLPAIAQLQRPVNRAPLATATPGFKAASPSPILARPRSGLRRVLNLGSSIGNVAIVALQRLDHRRGTLRLGQPRVAEFQSSVMRLPLHHPRQAFDRRSTPAVPSIQHRRTLGPLIQRPALTVAQSASIAWTVGFISPSCLPSKIVRLVLPALRKRWIARPPIVPPVPSSGPVRA